LADPAAQTTSLQTALIWTAVAGITYVLLFADFQDDIGEARRRLDDAQARSELMGVARKGALKVLTSAVAGSAVVFDFDDTLFDPSVVVSRLRLDDGRYPMYAPITEMHDVLRDAAKRNMRIILITARPNSPHDRTAVEANMRQHGLPLDELHMNMHFPRHRNFKAAIRRDIQSRGTIALTIGDAWGDVNEPGGADWIKVPASTDLLLASSRGVGVGEAGPVDWAQTSQHLEST